MDYYLQQGETQTGPLTLLQLRSMWADGELTAETMYWHDGATDWRPISDMSARLDQLKAQTPPKKNAVPSMPGWKASRRVIGGTGGTAVTRPNKARKVYIALGSALGLIFVVLILLAGYYRYVR